MGGIFSSLILGLIVGALAKFIMPGKDPGGIFVTIILGIVGAIVGRFVAGFLGFDIANMWSLPGFAIALAGAILLLVIYRVIKSRG